MTKIPRVKKSSSQKSKETSSHFAFGSKKPTSKQAKIYVTNVGMKRNVVFGSKPEAGWVSKGYDSIKLEELLAILRAAELGQRVFIEREGVPSGVVKEVIQEVGIDREEFRHVVGIPKATFTKKMKEKSNFSGTTGLSVVGLLDLINKVEDMISCDRENQAARDFDAAKWVGYWIKQPQPALGGITPAEIMDTPTGRASVMKVLGAIQSGAYQ